MSVNTTLVAAKAINDLSITVASATGVLPGMLAIIGGERLRVTSVDRAPTIGVVPGFDGTAATAHLRLSPVVFGTPDEFPFVTYLNAPIVMIDKLGRIVNDIPTVGSATPSIRASGHVIAATGALPSIMTYTPLVDTTLNIMCSLVVVVSSAEAFTASYSYTDTGGTARVATLPFRLLTGANVLAINFANGAIPYAGPTQQFRALAGTPVTLSTQGTFTGCTYSVSAEMFDSQP
jgi:hypothetical protein